MQISGDNTLIRTQISLDEQAYREAKAEARRQGVSLAEFLRRAVRMALPPGNDRPWMRYAGAVASGDPDASATVDDVVYGRGRP
jgi:Ribbon-helix-helix protein, copG family